MKIYEVELEYKGTNIAKCMLKTLIVVASDIEEAIKKAKEIDYDYEIVSVKKEEGDVII